MFVESQVGKNESAPRDLFTSDQIAFLQCLVDGLSIQQIASKLETTRYQVEGWKSQIMRRVALKRDDLHTHVGHLNLAIVWAVYYGWVNVDMLPEVPKRENFNPEEQTFLALMLKGHSQSEMAQILGVNKMGRGRRERAIISKMGVDTSYQAVAQATRLAIREIHREIQESKDV